jgi:hypothetical protein
MFSLHHLFNVLAASSFLSMGCGTSWNKRGGTIWYYAPVRLVGKSAGSKLLAAKER